jgi:transcriptional regulator with XRE-family HTH domain
MDNMNSKIGENLKKIRKNRNLTMDVLSKESDVSKSMISEIERGIRNPSITTLWKIANALKTPLNYFLKEDDLSSPTIYKMNEQLSIEGENYCFYPLMDFDEDKRFEIYMTEYLPGSQTDSTFHYDGVEEYVLISVGSIDLYLEEKKFNVKEGEVLHFGADKSHYYRNETDQICRAFILMFYPK